TEIGHGGPSPFQQGSSGRCPAANGGPSSDLRTGHQGHSRRDGAGLSSFHDGSTLVAMPWKWLILPVATPRSLVDQSANRDRAAAVRRPALPRGCQSPLAPAP